MIYPEDLDYCPDIDIAIPRADRIKDRVAELTAQIATHAGADKFIFDFELPDTECLMAYGAWRRKGFNDEVLGCVLRALIEAKLKQAAEFLEDK